MRHLQPLTRLRPHDLMPLIEFYFFLSGRFIQSPAESNADTQHSALAAFARFRTTFYFSLYFYFPA